MKKGRYKEEAVPKVNIDAQTTALPRLVYPYRLRLISRKSKSVHLPGYTLITYSL